MAPAPATRGSARAQQLQPAWSGSARLLEAAPACGQQSRARDQVPSAFGRRKVCSHGAERAGGVLSESCAPLPPRREPRKAASPPQFCSSTKKMLHRRRPLHAEGDEGNLDCGEIAARSARRARRRKRAAARDRVLLCRGHGNSGSGSTLGSRDATLLRSRIRQGASHSNQSEMRANWNQGRKCKAWRCGGVPS